MVEGSYGYRLPTEAQWEFAVRAGTDTLWSFGDTANGEYIWFSQNSQSETQEVGTRRANAWGLYDMHGNVWEWVWDLFDLEPYPALGSREDPEGPPLLGAVSGSFRVLRGGSWNGVAEYARSANRFNFSPSGRWSDAGFRLVRS
jgi:formylglycine-generating enzyme required for sulfatase activity